MKIVRYILYPFSLIYGGIMELRNLFFAIGFLPTTKVRVPVISIGNLSMGGTGKTPHVEYLARELSKKYQIAILMRGYGRKTNGFYEVTPHSLPEEVGDEALGYYHTFGDKIVVAVCEKRVDGAKRLLAEHPELECVLLDDGYQHRYIYRDINILLTEYARPFYKDFVVPSGQLREFRKGKKRADVVVVTKSPVDLKKEEKKQIKKKLNIYKKDVPVFFSNIQYGGLISFQNGKEVAYATNILLVTGIANPTPLLEFLKTKGNVKLLQFSDHHAYTLKDIDKIHKLFDTFASGDKVIVTTKKDASKLEGTKLGNGIKKQVWAYQTMEVEIEEERESLTEIVREKCWTK